MYFVTIKNIRDESGDDPAFFVPRGTVVKVVEWEGLNGEGDPTEVSTDSGDHFPVKPGELGNISAWSPLWIVRIYQEGHQNLERWFVSGINAEEFRARIVDNHTSAKIDTLNL